MTIQDLRHAKLIDLENTANRTFYFLEGLNNEIVSRIQRKIPEDYPNFSGLDQKQQNEFKDSCRWDWRITTKQMRDLLARENLYIEKEKDEKPQIY